MADVWDRLVELINCRLEYLCKVKATLEKILYGDNKTCDWHIDVKMLRPKNRELSEQLTKIFEESEKAFKLLTKIEEHIINLKSEKPEIEIKKEDVQNDIDNALDLLQNIDIQISKMPREKKDESNED